MDKDLTSSVKALTAEVRACRQEAEDTGVEFLSEPNLVMLLLVEEILHQLIDSLSHYLQGSVHPWCRISSINSISITNKFWLQDFQVSTQS